MDPLDVNSYIAAAEEALQNDPEYKHWFEALVKERIKAQDEYGFCPADIEGILFELWNTKIGYILDHKDEIETKIDCC